MPIYEKKNGSWIVLDPSHVNVEGVLKEVAAVFANIGGSWQEVWSPNEDTFIITPSVTRAEIQQILDTSVNGVCLLFEIGDYIFDAGLVIKYSNTYLVGKHGTRFVCDYVDNTYLIGTVDTGIRNIVIDGIYFDGKNSAGKRCGGVWMNKVGKAVTAGEYNLAYESTKVGVSGDINHGFLIRNCLIMDIQSRGIYILTSGNSSIDNVTIKNAQRGIYLWDECIDITVKWSKILHCGDFGIFSLKAYRLIVQGCVIQGNGVGFYSDSIQNSSIVSNLFESNVTTHINLYNTLRCSVSSNLIKFSNVANGIVLEPGSKGNNIVGNIIRSTKLGISNPSTATYNYYCGNLLIGNTTQISVTGTGVVNNNNRVSTT